MTQDPRNQYYHDDYPKQYQDPPGVQKYMNPQPDCGESSYEGTGQLKGRKALVTGGDSGIGLLRPAEGIAGRAFLLREKGRDAATGVVAPRPPLTINRRAAAW